MVDDVEMSFKRLVYITYYHTGLPSVLTTKKYDRVLESSLWKMHATYE